MTPSPAPNLTYTGAPSSGSTPWSMQAWREAVRTHALAAVPRGAAHTVLLLGSCFADRAGQFDLPISHWAQISGYTERSVSRAVMWLEAAALIQHIGPSDRHPQVRRYQFLVPDPTPDTHGTPDTGDHQPLTWVSKTPDTHVTQSMEKDGKKEGCKAAASLFEGPGFDRRAVRWLRWIGIPEREAHGLGTHYRPTAQQVRVVIANARGLRRVGKLRSARGFVRSAIERFDYRLDDQVLAWRRANHRRVQQHHHQAIAAQDQQARQRAQIERERQEAEAWAGMSSDQRQALRADIESALPPAARAMHARYPTDGPIWRSLILDHVMREVTR